MKIGILTYHRSNNYGALLQAIALRTVLSDNGHDVTFVDYWPVYQQDRYSLFSLRWLMKTQKGFFRKWKYVKNCAYNYNYRKDRNKVFSSFISEYILPYVSSYNDSYDIIIHGSDQIWRKQPEINSYDPVYFGNSIINAPKKISYAASMGFLPNEQDIPILKENLSFLDHISVRESNLLKFVSDIGYSVRQDLDPTLLLPSSRWKELFRLKDIEKPYVFYYKLQNTFDIRKMKAFAEMHNCNLRVISGKDRSDYSGDGYDEIEDPRQFLELLSNANYVFTSSFHGLAFALLFHKPFYASFKKVDRAYSLLSSLGLLNRLLKPKDLIPYDDAEIDYRQVDDTLELLRKNSLSYLVGQCIAV